MAATDLVTIQEAKDHLGLDGTAKDLLLKGAVSGTSLALEGFCRGPLIQRQFVERHTGGHLAGSPRYAPREFVSGVYGSGQRGGSKVIYLHRYPIVSVTTIVDEADTPSSIPSTDYYIRAETGELEHVTVWPTPYKGDLLGEWIVTYIAGRWANTAAVPAEVKLAALLYLGRIVHGGGGGVRALSSGTLSVSYASPGESVSGMPEDVRMLMAPYKVNRV